jgi:tripartite-type tricarboxylate transporter receptor subunit TctC
MFQRRSLLIGMLAALAAGASWTAHANTFPAKPITIVVGSASGSTTDGLARVIGEQVTLKTGQPVVIQNKPGASGAIAANEVARAAADGYTVFMTTNTTQSANPYLFKHLTYDPVNDFAPVGLLVKGYLILVTHPSVKANNVSELIAEAKRKPNSLSYGSGSSSARVAAELFQQMTGTQLKYVPYKSNPQAVIDLVGGHVDMMIVDLTTSLPQVKAGKLKALGVSSPQHSPAAPELPTISESGLPGYEMSYWNALYAPAKTSPAVVDQLNALFTAAVKTAPVLKFIEINGMEPSTSSAAALVKFQADELVRWGKIIRAAGIEPE